MKMKKNILSAFLLSTLCFQVALANTSYVNLHAEDEATIIIEDDFTSIKLDNSLIATNTIPVIIAVIKLLIWIAFNDLYFSIITNPIMLMIKVNNITILK